MEKWLWKRNLTEFGRSLLLMVTTNCFTESEQRMVKRLKNDHSNSFGTKPVQRDIYLTCSLYSLFACSTTLTMSNDSTSHSVLVSNLISSCPAFSEWGEKMFTSLYLMTFHVLQDVSGCSFIVYKGQPLQHFLTGCVFCICYSCAPLNSSRFAWILKVQCPNWANFFFSDEASTKESSSGKNDLFYHIYNAH